MGTKNDDGSRLKLLLADIRDAFAKRDGAEISSADIIKALVAIEGRPWAERGKNGKGLLGAILRKEVSPWHVEIEFERVRSTRAFFHRERV